MHIFDRYILSRIIVGTIFGVLCLSGVMMLGQLIKEIQELLESQQAPLATIAKFVWSSIPFMLTFSLPWAFLTAVILAFGKLSSSNELIGIRMAGWGIGRIAAPVVIFGALLTLFCYWLNGTVAPQAKKDVRDLIYEAVKQDPQSFLAPGTVQKRMGGDSRLYIEDKIGEELRGFHFYQLAGGAFPSSYVYAKEVEVTVTPDKQSLSLDLKEAYIENRAESSPILIADQAQPWIIELPNKSSRGYIGGMTNREIDHKLATEGMAMGERNYFRCIKKVTSRRSLAMACLCFGIIGVPLGMQSRRKENNRGFLVALGVATLYFGMVMGLEDVGDTALIRKSLIWLPNFLALGAAVIFYRKASFS